MLSISFGVDSVRDKNRLRVDSECDKIISALKKPVNTKKNFKEAKQSQQKYDFRTERIGISKNQQGTDINL
jgi:hypothetical protein